MPITRSRPVEWLGEVVSHACDVHKKTFYRDFKFGSIQGKIGDFVLVSNADSVNPDTTEGCDVAEIMKLYEIGDNNIVEKDPYRAEVRWFSRPDEIPKRNIRSLDLDRNVEIILDERPFDNDVSIEAFFGSCVVVAAHVNDDPLLRAMECKSHLPVFVCRYKLAISKQSTKIVPYLNSHETELKQCISKLASNSPAIVPSSHGRITKQSDLYYPHSSKVDAKKLDSTVRSHISPSNCKTSVTEICDEKKSVRNNRNTHKLETCFSTTDKSRVHRNCEDINDECNCLSVEVGHAKTKSNDNFIGRSMCIVVEKLQLGKDEQCKSTEDSRSCSPTIPCTEPSHCWYGIEDGKNHLNILKVPIKYSDSDRVSLKNGHEDSLLHFANTNSRESEDLILSNKDKADNAVKLSRKTPLKNDEKKQLGKTKLGKSDKCSVKEKDISEAKNFVYKKKLRDKDISDLLDDENSDDDIIISDKKNSKLISEKESRLKILKSIVVLNKLSQNTIVKQVTRRKTETASPTKQAGKCSRALDFMYSNKISRNSDFSTIENKVVKSSTISISKDDSILTSELTSPSKSLPLKKRHPEQWSLNEGTTKSSKPKTKPQKSEHISTPKKTLKSSLSNSLGDELLYDVSNSPIIDSCRNRLENVHDTTAKKKLFNEDKIIKGQVLHGESSRNYNSTNKELEVDEESTKIAEKHNDKNDRIPTTNSVCTSKTVDRLEPIHKSVVIDRYLESMNNSGTTNKHQVQSQKNSDHWISILEENNDCDASSYSSSVRLKLYRTRNNAESSDHKDGTPRRRKRQINADDNSDSKYEPASCSKSKRYKNNGQFTPKTDLNASPSVRSSSRKHKPNSWYDDNWTTPTNTPVHSLKKQIKNEAAVTPKTPMSRIASQTTTPISRKGSARRLLLTPSVPTRTGSVSTPGSVLEEARARLHVAAVPKSLPCREKEFENIYRFLEGKILDGAGGCMYISGVPGTGKTATVQEVVRSLQKTVACGDLPDFQFIELNGMRLTEPRQAYVQLLKGLTGQTMTAEQAQQLLERRFSRSVSRRITTLLLVDELDLLWTRRQDVVYNLLDWPTKTESRLVVLTIANTMDLPERLLMGRVTSRLGLTRVTFHPYTHKQLQQIVMARLTGLEAFDPDAVQLVARKVAAVSGDARRALDICRRATELAEGDLGNCNEIVTMQHVDQALSEMIASSKVQAIRCCSKMEKLFIQAVAAETQRTGVEETVFEKVYVQLRTLCTLDGYTTPSITESLRLCARLGSCRLLLTEHSRTDIHQRILLNVSSDDIHYALQVH